MYRHYIRVNKSNEVVAGFSNAFEQPLPTDICITPDGTGERHFNPQLQERGVWAYTWDGEAMVKRDVDPIAKPIEERNATLARLAALDVVIPRALEDLYKATGKKPYATVQTAIDEKAELRSKL
jgi:hypothetical protein